MRMMITSKGGSKKDLPSDVVKSLGYIPVHFVTSQRVHLKSERVWSKTKK